MGACVDCNKCVQVCPTGIDIRQGLQMECIGCAACIDACDGIMDKLKRERGLIRYDSIEGLSANKPTRLKNTTSARFTQGSTGMHYTTREGPERGSPLNPGRLRDQFTANRQSRFFGRLGSKGVLPMATTTNRTQTVSTIESD